MNFKDLIKVWYELKVGNNVIEKVGYSTEGDMFRLKMKIRNKKCRIIREINSIDVFSVKWTKRNDNNLRSEKLVPVGGYIGEALMNSNGTISYRR